MLFIVFIWMQLRHNSGSIVYSAAQVSVPYVQPGFVGTLMVDLIVPDLPGLWSGFLC